MSTVDPVETVEGFSHTTWKNEKVEVPFTLRELGEIPKSFIPVYVGVDPESLSFVGENGLKAEDNRREQDPAETYIKEVGDRMGITINRTKCVFAYPEKPNNVAYQSNGVLLEVWVDPNSNILVADTDDIGEVLSELHSSHPIKSREFLAEDIEDYWRNAKPFKDYLHEKHNNGAGSANSYMAPPELLIPYDIPTSRIRVLPKK
jgi:hypothetical protein